MSYVCWKCVHTQLHTNIRSHEYAGTKAGALKCRALSRTQPLTLPKTHPGDAHETTGVWGSEGERERERDRETEREENGGV